MSIEQFTIKEMQAEDVAPATEMRLQSWLDTYVNEEFGVTREWIERRNAMQRSPENTKRRLESFTMGKQSGTRNGWIALDSGGKVIGATTPWVDDAGVQHVGSLYVDRAWHGKGVGGGLMEKVIDWFDDNKPIELGVVAYNERAKAFYCKWGFEEVAGSEQLFDGKIPEVKMIRSTRWEEL